ncbi:hypothetical protein GW933_01100 [Candidatus Falkowbacteria bacterium]|uniref:Uncharacterized protein n=1 Tax=Candidatus Buchananbacteria bacterium CG10_big_fil_rev_8_21_14_0_10_33_19 TaxID=1974525 RepID=A0A2H0W5D9_9BACT|nr:hypothetical protein [Candidatus Falkowbacteria bacterium]PIS05850.1 MAG: hypothetical protein COT80_03730 [Candidatus Buchananbacteria bacterium CG10_big_fil_rev_8_21_14_0_10_33_19]
MDESVERFFDEYKFLNSCFKLHGIGSVEISDIQVKKMDRYVLFESIRYHVQVFLLDKQGRILESVGVSSGFWSNIRYRLFGHGCHTTVARLLRDLGGKVNDLGYIVRLQPYSEMYTTINVVELYKIPDDFNFRDMMAEIQKNTRLEMEIC